MPVQPDFDESPQRGDDESPQRGDDESPQRGDDESLQRGQNKSPQRGDDSRAVFHLDGDRLVPNGLARGPWYPDTQHGSAMLGLLARAIDRHPAAGPVQVVRFTADMMRAAPMNAVETPIRVLRGGKSVEVLEATIEAGGECFARATAMRFRTRSIDVSGHTPRYGGGRFSLPSERDLPSSPDFGDHHDQEAFHHTLEMRPPLGCETPAMWFRMGVPLVAGEPLTPFVRTALISDWTYSVPYMHRLFTTHTPPDEQGFSAINPDTSLNLHRPIEGEWLCLDAHAHYGEAGAGTAGAARVAADRPPSEGRTLQQRSGALRDRTRQ